MVGEADSVDGGRRRGENGKLMGKNDGKDDGRANERRMEGRGMMEGDGRE